MPIYRVVFSRSSPKTLNLRWVAFLVTSLGVLMLSGCQGNDQEQTPTEAPKILSASAGDTIAVLNWDPVQGAAGYRIYWATSSGSGKTGTLIADTAPGYIHRNLTNGETLFYVVTATGAAGESEPSAEASATPDFIPLTGLSFPDTNLDTCVKGSAATYVSQLTALYCNGKNITNLFGLGALTSLLTLVLNSNPTLTDVSPLSTLRGIQSLNLSYTGVTDITSLGGVTDLKTLYLRYTNISDLSGLESLANLNFLFLGNNLISDLNPLANLTELTTVQLGHNAITDLGPLASLTNLNFLSLDYNTISDLSPLANLTALESLTFQDNSISDLSPLGNLTALTTLNLVSNPDISDLSPLANLVNLNSLLLINNPWVTDISPLANLTSLTNLNLSLNGISDVSPLASLINLKQLYLTSNSISDISALDSLTGLTHLNLGGNALTDVSSLATLVNLQYLYLHVNNITGGVAALTTLTNPTKILLTDNPSLPCADVIALDAALDGGNGETLGKVTWNLCL